MLNKRFNKIGGTEFRVKDQIIGYLNVIEWVVDLGKKTNEEFKKEFIKWAKDEGVYTYSSEDKYNRFKMVISNITNDIKVLEFIDQSYRLTDDFKKDDPINSFLSKLLDFYPERKYPFRKMIEFMHSNPDKNNSKKIANSFMVFDGCESFEELYDMNIIDELVRRELCLVNANNKFSEIFKFPKKPKNIDVMETIFLKLRNNAQVNLEDLQHYDQSNDRYLRKIFFRRNENFCLTSMIAKINEISFAKYCEKLLSVKYENTLNKDYFDLFNRWMFGLNLCTSASISTETYDSSRLCIENEKFLILPKESATIYPFSLVQTKIFLEKIDVKDFSFKNDIDKIASVKNSVLAEYFVNLFFCYIFEVSPVDFSKYVNTKVSSELFPVFTAPGGASDMVYFNKHECFYIETTIHNTVNATIRNEAFQSVLHITQNEENHKKPNTYLIFISMFSDNLDVKRAISLYWPNVLANKKRFLSFSFSEVSKKDIDIIQQSPSLI